MKLLNPKYVSTPYKTPNDYKNKYSGATGLIIGTGVSTSNILPYKDELKKHFDVIVGVNFATKDFESQMDFHVVAEKDPVNIYVEMNKPDINNRLDLPRVFNWKTIPKYPKNLNFIKMMRNPFSGKPNIREYRYNGTEGLLAGPTTVDGLSAGTVILQALHMTCILGCENIYLVGADFVFSEKYDHYYQDRLYRGDTKKPKDWGTPLIEVNHDGKKYQTLRIFKDSADYINYVIDNLCKPAGANVYSFSDGLVTNAIPADAKTFFNG